MKYTELKKDIAEGDRRIYLFEGEDAYFRTHGEEQVRRAFLSMPELNFSSFEGSLLKGRALSDLTSAMSAYPFMAEKRMIRVGEFYPSEADYEKYLKTAFENCPPTTILVIVNQGAGKGARLRSKKCITYVDCSRADEETVARWAYATLRRAGISADAQACANIAAYCLCNMARVEGEVQKIIEYGKPAITVADVDALVYKDSDYRIYELTDAIACKNYSRFCTICGELSARSSDRTSIVSALHRYFKNLLVILSSGEDAKTLSSRLGMPEFAVRKSAGRARAFGREKLLAYTSALYDFSARMRSGRLSPDGAFYCALAEVLFG